MKRSTAVRLCIFFALALTGFVCQANGWTGWGLLAGGLAGVTLIV